MNLSSSQPTSSQFRSNVQNLKKPNDEVMVCPFSNIRIVRPMIQLDLFKSKMSDKKMVKLNNIRLHLNKQRNDIDGDWVTIAVVIDKLPTRKTKNGADFSIWKLSDLQSLDKLATLMLFGDAHDTQWKLGKGSVIGLLNSKILPNKDGKNDLTLSIERGTKLMHLGSSKDMGNCKAPKNNGDFCNSLINTSLGNFCIYHIKADYSKLSALRPELTQAMVNLGVTNKSGTGKNLQTFNSFKKNMKNEEIKIQDSGKMTELMDKYQSRKALEVDNLSKQLKDNQHSITARNLVKYQNSTDPNAPKKETTYDAAKKLLSTMNEKQNGPVLGKGWKKGEVFDFGRNRKVTSVLTAKQKAIEMMKNRKIEKEDPNRVFSSNQKKNKLDLSNILNKVESNLVESEENLNMTNLGKSKDLLLNSDYVERRKRKAQEEVQAKKAKLEAINAIMNRKSSHEFELKDQEIEAQGKYFQLMEKKEKMEDHMNSVFQIECNVVICKVCSYTAHSQSDFCESKRHLVISKKAIKRFFRCKNCSSRTHTFNQIYPSKSCSKCGSDQFDKASMYNIKDAPKSENEKLLIRGEELKFLNSLK